MIFALHNLRKFPLMLLKILKKVGDLSRYAGDWEKVLKILRLPPNAGELTVMIWCTTKCEEIQYHCRVVNKRRRPAISPAV